MTIVSSIRHRLSFIQATLFSYFHNCSKTDKVRHALELFFPPLAITLGVVAMFTSFYDAIFGTIAVTVGVFAVLVTYPFFPFTLPKVRSNPAALTWTFMFLSLAMALSLVTAPAAILLVVINILHLVSLQRQKREEMRHAMDRNADVFAVEADEDIEMFDSSTQTYVDYDNKNRVSIEIEPYEQDIKTEP